MPASAEVILLTAAAGAAIPSGGYLASHSHIQSRWLCNEFRHSVIALGAGILLGAVAMVLVPTALNYLQYSDWSIAFLLGGGFIFYGLERYLDVHRHNAPQLTGMLLDFLPESLALGGLAASGADPSTLLRASIAGRR
jgi:ZIP family zinc transporter